MNIDPVISRVDSLMHETLAGKDIYSNLWNVNENAPCSFTWSSGFSINRQTEEVNLQAESFVAKSSAIMCTMLVALSMLM